MTTNTRLLTNFNFSVRLRKSAQISAGNNLSPNKNITASSNSNDALGDGGFQECSGLEISMDVQEYQEGGRNDGTIQQIGRAKYSNIVLKRGMFFNEQNAVENEMWNWLQDIVSGKRPARRYDGIIEVLNQGRDVVATWVFERGLPVKIVGPQLNAKSGDVAIEEIHIAHEGLRLRLS